MSRLVSIYKGTTGIDNKVDPVRLEYDPERGVKELAAGVNVDVDRTGRISRRKGYTLKLEKDCHSLFPCIGYALFVSGDALCVLEPSYAWSAIRNVTVGARMRYVRAGRDTYYLNEHERGIVRDRVSYAWNAGDYVGPDTTKAFSDPPIGHLIELYNGRMLIGKDDVLWYSEPFAWAWFDFARNFVSFHERLTMVKAVKGGVFVSTESEIYFLGGENIREASLTKMADYPAIEGTEVTVDASKLGDGSIKGLSAMWTTPKGICFGGPNGAFENLTARRLVYPTARYGAGLYRDGKYVCLLQP